MIDPADAAHIAELARHLGEIRQARVLTASRLCSQLESATRPLRDPHLNKLVDLVQGQLARMLADPPKADAG